MVNRNTDASGICCVMKKLGGSKFGLSRGKGSQVGALGMLLGVHMTRVGLTTHRFVPMPPAPIACGPSAFLAQVAPAPAKSSSDGSGEGGMQGQAADGIKAR